MPEFEQSAPCRAPAVEVWKLLYDPARYPEWWDGMERIETGPAGTTRHMGALPNMPIPTRVEPAGDGSRVVISCLLTQIAHEWTLEPAVEGCTVRVRVTIPEDQHDWLEQQRAEIGGSIRRLAAAAEEAARRA